MAKTEPAVPKKAPDCIVKVAWPILEIPKRDIRSNILSVLDLIRSQMDNEFITIFHIQVGRSELDGLIIKYGIHEATMNYFRDVNRDSMRIFFKIPSPKRL